MSVTPNGGTPGSVRGSQAGAPAPARSWSRVILDLDRRIIYGIVFLLVLIPLIRPLKLPIEQTDSVRKGYEMVENLKEGEALLISVDFGPSTAPECQPVYVSLLHQCFRKGVRPIIVSLVPDGRGMAIRGLNIVRNGVDSAGQPHYPDLVDGEDYAFLGYKAGTLGPIVGMGQSFAATFPRDANNRPIGELPLMRRFKKLGDCGAIFTVAAVGTPDYWLPYGSERYHVPMAVSCTAVSAAQYSPYYISGQFVGLVNGMKGAAEYEAFVGLEQITGLPGDATKGMDAQTMVHIFIVLAIILANVALFAERRASPRRRIA
ncbi:MAG: hypothetical protein M3R04_01310 [bacterium]|nr:hypothetical protein [bacterium]